MASVRNDLTTDLDADVGEGLDTAPRALAARHDRLGAVAGSPA